MKTPMTQPKHYPPFGLHIPASGILRAVDGDTVIVQFGSDREWRIRLLDCWCPEMNTKAGKEAKKTAEEFIEAADSISVFIPLRDNPRDVLNEIVTMGRLLGFVYLREDQTLNRLMVTAGMASTVKGGELGR